jgi:membrane-associated phospholipid phosphatase
MDVPRRGLRGYPANPRIDDSLPVAGVRAGLARRLVRPRSGSHGLVQQLLVWVVLGLAYEGVRGTAGHDREAALRDGRAVIRIERELHLFFETHLQHLIEHTAVLGLIVRGSYWGSEFSVLIVALAWSYWRHRPTYRRFRDSVLIANGLGLLGYLLMPTAPPRVFERYGFTNAVSGQPTPAHATGLLGFAANPYAAMPSIHCADALLTGVFLASLTRRRLARLVCALWPAWVAFAVIASGNHFWLDVLAGLAVAGVGLLASHIASSVIRSRLRPLSLQLCDPLRPAGAATRTGRRSVAASQSDVSDASTGEPAGSTSGRVRGRRRRQRRFSPTGMRVRRMRVPDRCLEYQGDPLGCVECCRSSDA